MSSSRVACSRSDLPSACRNIRASASRCGVRTSVGSHGWLRSLEPLQASASALGPCCHLGCTAASCASAARLEPQPAHVGTAQQAGSHRALTTSGAGLCPKAKGEAGPHRDRALQVCRHLDGLLWGICGREGRLLWGLGGQRVRPPRQAQVGGVQAALRRRPGRRDQGSTGLTGHTLLALWCALRLRCCVGRSWLPAHPQLHRLHHCRGWQPRLCRVLGSARRMQGWYAGLSRLLCSIRCPLLEAGEAGLCRRALRPSRPRPGLSREAAGSLAGGPPWRLADSTAGACGPRARRRPRARPPEPPRAWPAGAGCGF